MDPYVGTLHNAQWRSDLKTHCQLQPACVSLYGGTRYYVHTSAQLMYYVMEWPLGHKYEKGNAKPTYLFYIRVEIILVTSLSSCNIVSKVNKYFQLRALH